MDENELRAALRMIADDIPDLAAIRSELRVARARRQRRYLAAILSGAFTVIVIVVLAILVGRPDSGKADEPATADAFTESESSVAAAGPAGNSSGQSTSGWSVGTQTNSIVVLPETSTGSSSPQTPSVKTSTPDSVATTAIISSPNPTTASSNGQPDGNPEQPVNPVDPTTPDAGTPIDPGPQTTEIVTTRPTTPDPTTSGATTSNPTTSGATTPGATTSGPTTSPSTTRVVTSEQPTSGPGSTRPSTTPTTETPSTSSSGPTGSSSTTPTPGAGGGSATGSTPTGSTTSPPATSSRPLTSPTPTTSQPRITLVLPPTTTGSSRSILPGSLANQETVSSTEVPATSAPVEPSSTVQPG